jgi:hypothetical protein
VLRAIQRTERGNIVFLVGLAGAGKSKLSRVLLNEVAGHPETWGAGRIPAIRVRAAPTDRSYYSPKDMQSRLNVELQGPRLDWLSTADDGDDAVVDALEQDISESHRVWQKLRTKLSENDMRRVFEATGRARGLTHLFIDQAGSIAFTQRGRAPSEHMYSLMCLGEEIPVTLVLFGTPRMQALWDGNREICRRSTINFFPRYRSSQREDMEALGRLCLTLSAGLTFEPRARPVNALRTIYAATLGVFDEVRTLFERAEQRREASGAAAISQVHLETAVRTKRELETLYEDAILFDQMMEVGDPLKAGGKEISI